MLCLLDPAAAAAAAAADDDDAMCAEFKLQHLSS